MVKKLNIKTVTKKQLGDALVYTGKLVMSHDYNEAQVKHIRKRFTNFINQLKAQRKDLCIVHDLVDDTDFDNYTNPQICYNHVTTGRSFLNCGLNLLHPKSNIHAPSHFHTTENKFIELFFKSGTTTVSLRTYKQIVKAVKSGQNYNDVMDKVINRVAKKVNDTQDYYADNDDEDAEALNQMDDALEGLDNARDFANKYGKSKEQKTKLFLAGLFAYRNRQ